MAFAGLARASGVRGAEWRSSVQKRYVLVLA